MHTARLLFEAIKALVRSTKHKYILQSGRKIL